MLRRLALRVVDARGTALVEGVMGIVLLLAAMLAALQVMLVSHAALAGRSAALRVARTYGLTCSQVAADQEWLVQQEHTLPVISWDGPPTYGVSGGLAYVTVRLRVPPVFPGAGVFGGGGLTGPLYLAMRGAYPIGGRC